MTGRAAHLHASWMRVDRLVELFELRVQVTPACRVDPLAAIEHAVQMIILAQHYPDGSLAIPGAPLPQRNLPDVVERAGDEQAVEVPSIEIDRFEEHCPSPSRRPAPSAVDA